MHRFLPNGLYNPDMPAQTLRLIMGELTTDEVRIARAAIRLANSARKKSDMELACDRLWWFQLHVNKLHRKIQKLEKKK